MVPIAAVTDIAATPPNCDEPRMAAVDAPRAAGDDVDPVPIGDPDDDEGYVEEDDEEEDDDEDEEPLQCAGPASPTSAHLFREGSLIVSPVTIKAPRPR